jgi:hypothetical protein
MRKLLTQSAVAVLLFAGVAAGNPPAPRSAAAPKVGPPSPAAQGDQPVLQPYTSSDGRFSVQFPAGEVKTGTEPIPLTGNDTSTLYEFWIESDGGNVSYMVMYNDYPPAYANDGADAVLGRTRDGALKGKTTLSDMAISLNGVPGREFTAKDDTWNYTVRQFLSGKRLYQMIVVSKPDHPATLTSAFLDSFKIL